MRAVGYGVIGLGFFGEKHAEVVASLPQVELRAVCTRREERLQEVQYRLGVPRAYRDYHELLADPDVEAVSVVTHVDDHDRLHVRRRSVSSPTSTTTSRRRWRPCGQASMSCWRNRWPAPPRSATASSARRRRPAPS